MYCTVIITKACLLRCKITYTQITVIIDTSEQGYNAAISSDVICKITHTRITIIIDTSEQGYNAAISSWRDMQNHTHIDLARRSSILLHMVIDQVHFCWWLRELILVLQWDHKAFWTCTFGLQEHSASGGRKQWSLHTGWNCSSWCHEVLGYLPQTRLRARGMSQGFFWQQCSRDEQPNHPYHKNSSSNWEIEEKEEVRKAKACALQDLFFAP
jgi:hypothetical protein